MIPVFVRLSAIAYAKCNVSGFKIKTKFKCKYEQYANFLKYKVPKLDDTPRAIALQGKFCLLLKFNTTCSCVLSLYVLHVLTLKERNDIITLLSNDMFGFESKSTLRTALLQSERFVPHEIDQLVLGLSTALKIFNAALQKQSHPSFR